MGFDPGATYPTNEVPIGRGDRLLLYTDGILEVTNAAGELFGVEGLASFVETKSSLSTNDFADGLLAHLRRWAGRGGGSGPFDDDLTLAVVDLRA